MSEREIVLKVDGVAKSFTMHLRGGSVLPVVREVRIEVSRGECVVLGGPSGIGKSSLITAGKPTKVALTAIMRKLIVLANALLRQRRNWAENPA
jgi:ABC-type glutathione transport system ATPase component